MDKPSTKEDGRKQPVTKEQSTTTETHTVERAEPQAAPEPAESK